MSRVNTVSFNKEEFIDSIRKAADDIKRGRIKLDPSGSAPHDMSLTDPNIQEIVKGKTISLEGVKNNTVEIPDFQE